MKQRNGLQFVAQTIAYRGMKVGHAGAWVEQEERLKHAGAKNEACGSKGEARMEQGCGNNGKWAVRSTEGKL